MKHLIKAVAFLLSAVLAVGFAGCGEGPHTHTAGSEWESDSANHWHICTECGEETDKAAHISDGELHFNADYTQQWNECTVCGAEMNKTAHTHAADESEWESDGVYHWRICSVCGQKVESTQTEHELGVYESDETGHWKVCNDCGAVVGKEAHTAGETETDGTTDIVKCEDCGYVMSSTAHRHVTDGYMSDETQHWQVCSSCNEEVNKADHIAGEWTYDDTQQKDVRICSVCHYKMAERDHVHAYNVWTNDGGEDVVGCICGEKYEISVQKINLDLQYTNSIVSENITAQAEIDLSSYEGISYKGATLGSEAITATFENGILTMGVVQFGFKYGENTLVISVSDADGVARTINVPVILVTKIFIDKEGLDSMGAIAKECEAADPNLYGGYFELGDNISYNAEFNYVMAPNIADTVAETAGFKGTFDGCGYTIDGMQINRRGSDTPYGRWSNYYGMFGILRGGTVKNVRYTNAEVAVKGSVVAAYGTGLIENVYVSFKAIRPMSMADTNPIGAFFSHSAQSGATLRDCVVDITNIQYLDGSGAPFATGEQFCAGFYVLGQWPIYEGVYLIGAPEGLNPFGAGVPNASDIYGVYESMDAFAVAYNAENSAVKTEIDTWDATYWSVTDGKISFKDKNAA